VNPFYRWLVGRPTTVAPAPMGPGASSTPSPSAPGGGKAGEGGVAQQAPAHDQPPQPQPVVASAVSGDVVDVYANGTLVPLMQMVVDENGECTFAQTGSNQPSPQALASMPVQFGANKLKFVYR
jgi:hypothetical protein